MMQSMKRGKHTINCCLRGGNEGAGDKEPTKVKFLDLKKVIFYSNESLKTCVIIYLKRKAQRAQNRMDRA